MRKQVSIAFQRRILREGQHLVEVSQNKAFLQKRLPEKNSFLSITIPDQLTLEGLVPQISKGPTFSTCSLKNLGHKLSDEVLGSTLASILSNQQPLEFFENITKKCKKHTFFAFVQITRDFDVAPHIQGTTM